LCCEFIAGYHRAFCQKTIRQTQEAVLPNPHVPRREMKIRRWQSSFDELNRLEYLTKTNKAGKIKSKPIQVSKHGHGFDFLGMISLVSTSTDEL